MFIDHLNFWIPLCISLLLFLTMAHVVPVMVWVERRGAGFIQNRLGPNVVGPFGLFQPLADAIKLIFKSDVTPKEAHSFFFFLAPVLVVTIASMSVAVIPFSGEGTWGTYPFRLQVANIPVGLLYILAIGSFSVYGILLAGWSSRNKYALFGALRASAQMVSYEIALGIGIATCILVFGSYDLNEIVSLQGSALWNWGIVKAPLTFVLLLITLFAETNRLPFDLAEGEAEIVGFHVEYSSMSFALFFMAEYMHMFVGSSILTCLFLGGWHIPGIPQETLTVAIQTLSSSPNFCTLMIITIQFLVMMIKIAILLWVFVWIRWSFPRFRYDQLMRFGWKGLIPFGLISLIMSAITTYIYQSSP